MKTKETKKNKEYECSCKECARLCERQPGWPTPQEARMAIEAGYADRYMRDWWDGHEKVYIICPASKDCGGREAPEIPDSDGFLGGFMAIAAGWTKGRCVLLKDGLCEIHDSGFKPVQCREALGCKAVDPRDGRSQNEDVMKLWDTDEGREVVKLWEKALAE